MKVGLGFSQHLSQDLRTQKHQSEDLNFGLRDSQGPEEILLPPKSWPETHWLDSDPAQASREDSYLTVLCLKFLTDKMDLKREP